MFLMHSIVRVVFQLQGDISRILTEKNPFDLEARVIILLRGEIGMSASGMLF